MKLLYEIKKMMPLKKVMILMIVFLLFNCANIYKNYYPACSGYSEVILQKGRVAVYKLLEGKISEEKYNTFLEEYDRVCGVVESGNYSNEVDFDKYYCGYAYGDRNIFYEVLAEFERQILYPSSVSKIKEEMEANMDFFEEIGNFLLYEENKYVLSCFSDRHIRSFYYTSPSIYLFEYSFSSVLIIILILLIFSPVFSLEKENEMLEILHCTKYGCNQKCGNTVWLYKIGLLLVMVTLLTVLFGLSDIIMLKVCLKFNGLSQPIYILEEFSETNLTCSIFESWLICNAIKWFGFVIIGLVVCVISKTQCNSNFSYVISLLFVALCIFTNVYLTSETGRMINLFNPISLLTLYKVFANFEIWQTDHFFVMRYAAVIGANVATFITFMLLYMFPKLSSVRFRLILRIKGGIRRNVN